MAQPLLLRTHHHPSLFNKDMVLGAFIGSIMPGLGTLIGGLIGGLIGKHSQENENKNGKPVGTPTFWNKDMLLGSFIGTAVGFVAGIAILMTDVSFFSGAPVTASVGAVIASMGSVVGGTLLGSYVGGKSGEAHMIHDYEEAKYQQIVDHLGQSISPEIAQAVEYRLVRDKEWGKKMLAEKLAATRKNILIQ